MSVVIPASSRSWIEVAPDNHFPIQNLPYARFLSPDGRECAGFRIGDFAFDLLGFAAAAGVELPANDRLSTTLRRWRQVAFDFLRAENDALRDNADLRRQFLFPVADVTVVTPNPAVFVDFYAGIHHASNVGKMFRPDQPPLLPNYKHVPIGYHGRATTVVGSGHSVVRPKGQVKPADGPPVYQPTGELDFELELGFLAGAATTHGDTLLPDRAREGVLGFVLINDWSARDVQRWEYQPLGPYLAKSFMTSASDWMVLPDALEPFRVVGMEQDPAPLAHLAETEPRAFDIHLEVWIQSARMTRPQRICVSNTQHVYWSHAQQLAHQSSNGTPLVPGEMYATGTISGPEAGTYGSLLELSWRGSQPLTLEETGETRTFLEDGDVVTMTGWAQGDGFRVGFGELVTRVDPAR